ncbi:MAG: NAD(P)-binding domain-containing protein [Acidobacteriota bacterium]|nr:NAD(P)-binding domain-containing protein [Acidobacteriota bacterium]
MGREVATRARAFGMRVVAWSRSLTDELAAELGVERRENLRDVAREADVVSVHVALKPETRGLIGSDFFGAMREGAYFINTSRGDVVDQDALRRAMREKGIRAGLDVYASEPAGGAGEFTDDIAREPNLYGTHHIGASTDQAQEAIAAETVRIIETFKETGRVPNVVNLARRTPATHTLVVRHRDRPGVLASVLDAIRGASINVQEMENIVFEGAEAAVARINLEASPPSDVLEQLKASNADIIELSLLTIS